MKSNARLEDSIFDALMCREVRSFTRPLHGHKGKKIRREAHLRTRKTMKILMRMKQS